MSGDLDCRRNRLAVRLANAALALATPRYRRFLRESLDYGMHRALDAAAPPVDWSPHGTDPLPAFRRRRP